MTEFLRVSMINNSAAESIDFVGTAKAFSPKHVAYAGCPSDVLIPDHIHPCHSQTVAENLNLQTLQLVFFSEPLSLSPRAVYLSFHSISLFYHTSHPILFSTCSDLLARILDLSSTDSIFLYGRCQILKLLPLLYPDLYFQPIQF